LIGVFEIAANGKAAGEAGHFDPQRFKLLTKIEGGRVPFHTGIGGEDHFLDIAI
jgi:hypothetical protein